MSNDVIDIVRLLAPDATVTSDLGRARQRRKLDEAIAAEMVLPDTAGAPPQRRWRAALNDHRRRAFVGAAAAVAVAAGVAVPLSLGAGSPAASSAAGPVIQLASYRLRLPSNYRLTAATSTCPMTPAFVAAHVAAIAYAPGGCFSMVLTPPYTPTAPNPDPEAALLTNPQPVQVGQYKGIVGTVNRAKKPAGGQQESLLVQIPLASGQDQDVVVSSYGLSQDALVSLVANGLSAEGAPSTPGTLPIKKGTVVVGNSGTSGNSEVAGNSGDAGSSGAPANNTGTTGTS